MAERERVGQENGFYVEIFSAVAIGAARDIAMNASGLTVAIRTSTGLKDSDPPGADFAGLTVLEPTVDRLDAWVAATRGVG